VFYKNETRHVIELPGTEQRIRAKTAWDADTLRGDYADFLILDEYQLMKSEAWELVGAPMLLDNDGDALFIYTKKKGAKGRHASELYKRAEADGTGRWAAFNFTSHDNPYISEDALADITQDMTNLAYRMEIMAEEIEDDPAALWTRETLRQNRVTSHPDLDRVVVGVDPPGSVAGDECGIVAAGIARVDGDMHGYVIHDASGHGTPAEWGGQCVATYNLVEADRLVAEKNFGGDMVEHTIRTVEGGDRVAFSAVWASRGKAVRAEPIAAYYERGLVHHVGMFEELEDELCMWVPGDKSPNRLDAAVWALTELMLGSRAVADFGYVF
jgi:phage terminase large subunit-like protein